MLTEKLILLPIMLYCHIIDDYKLQGILASMKQKKWWEDNAAEPLYKNDYKMALWEHAFCWSFSIALPPLIVALLTHNNILMSILILFYPFNTILHAYIDDLKANKHDINLVQDQLCHISQIIGLWGVVCMSM